MLSTAASASLFSPISLSYGAALRGVVPRAPGTSFTFVQIGALDPQSLLCLAASNPDGLFYGLLPNAETAVKASGLAQARHVGNVFFLSACADLPEKITYLCADKETLNVFSLTAEEAFDLAEKRLVPGGLFSFSFPSFENPADSLRFLIQEYVPELSAGECGPFLRDLLSMGALFFEADPQARAALERALETDSPDAFLTAYGKEGEAARSGAFETLAALLPRGFAFAGDALIGSNYLELTVPAQAQEGLLKRQEHLLYEPFKDFVLQRKRRQDVWVKLPATQTLDGPTLFNAFTFGITTPRENVPQHFAAKGKAIDLTTPLLKNLMDLMCVLPVGIGDFLQHPLGKPFAPGDVLEAVHLLVALGIAQPMRGRFEGNSAAAREKPVWATGFNAHFKDEPLTESIVRLASPIIGNALALPVREALVLQALSRVGLANVSGSLMPELERLATENPALAACVMDSAEPSEEGVHRIVTDVIQRNMARWFAYGLLAA